MFKTAKLNRSKISSITGAIMNDFRGQHGIVPVWKRGMSNCIVNSSSGEYDGGERVIGFPNGYEVDGDLLFTVGWGDGFAVRRLNNDGTLTKLYHNNQFLYRDTTSTYNHIQQLAICKDVGKGVAMTHNVYGYTLFDYNGLKNGGTTFTMPERPSHSNPQFFIGSQDTSNGYVRRAGVYYASGLCAAGDWVYVHEYDARHYYKVMRRNLRTNAEEILDTRTDSVKQTGSATPDRAGFRGWIFYDEVNDRIFYATYYNANFTLVLNASTANPRTVWVDCGDAGLGDDGYEQGLFIEDPVNEPNIVWIGANSRIAKIDMTPCFTGSSPTVLAQRYTEDSNRGNQFGVLFRAGTKYQSVTGDATDKSPTDPRFIPTTSDRGYGMLDGWIDQDNDRIVALLRHDSTTEDTTSWGRGRSYRSDYGTPVFKMYSSNGTPYWIKLGYGYDGHSFKVWTDEYGNKMADNWEIQFGTFTLDNSANIDFVYWDRNDWFSPSGCTLSFFVSNNNGSTWEAYTGTDDSEHTFSSTGTQLKVKAVATGTEYRNSYKMSNTQDSIIYGTKYAAQKDPQVKTKISRFKIRGKR